MMKKILKAFLYMLGAGMLLLLIFFTLLYFNQDRLKNLLLAEINTYLQVPVDVGSVDISLRKFPDASLLFTKVYTAGLENPDTDTLLYAEEIFLHFHIWDVLSSHIRVKQISVEEGNLHIVQGKGDFENYRIWKTDSSREESAFALEEIILEDMAVRYFYRQENNLEINTHLAFYQLRGDIMNPAIPLENKAELELHQLSWNEKTYIRAAPLQLDFFFSVSGDEFRIKDAVVLWQDWQWEMAYYQNAENRKLEARSTAVDLKVLTQITNEQNWYSLPEKVDIDGNATLSVNYNADEAKYVLDSRFSLDKGRLKKGDNSLENLQLKGHYILSNKNDELILEEFSGRGKTGAISGKARLTDLQSPLVDLNILSDISLQEWLLIFPAPHIEEASADMKLDLQFRNKFSSTEKISAQQLRSAQVKGNLQLENGELKLRNLPETIHKLNGEFQFDNILLEIKRMFFTLGKSDLYLEGNFENIWPYLLVDGEDVRIRARLKSQYLDAENFMFAQQGSEQSQNEARGEVHLNLLLQLDELKYKTFFAREVNGKITKTGDHWTGREIRLLTDDGVVKGDIDFGRQADEHYHTSARVNIQNVDIHKLFLSFNNFSQSAISSENIFGQLTADIDFSGTFDPSLQILPNSIKLQTHLLIKDGQLLNYEPMNALSDYAEISELKNVKFSTLENDISISQSVIKIPAMDVKSNVLNFSLYGTHSFENEIEYHLKLKLADVLFSKRKAKKRQSEFDEFIYEEQAQDAPLIPILIRGTVDAPEIILDRADLQKGLKKDLEEQGQELKNIFKKEKPDTTRGTGIKYRWEEDDN